MKVILVENLSGGEVLANAICSGDKSVLVPKGTALRKEYIELLISLNIKEVYIEDIFRDIEQGNYLMPDEKENEFYEEIKNILEKYIYGDNTILKKIRPVAEKIVDTIMNEDINKVYDYKLHTADLYSHTLKVAFMCVMLGRKMGMSKEELYLLAEGALFHDIGLRFISVSYSDFDMDKRDPNEVYELKKHTILGYSAMENIEWLSGKIKTMVLSHHERVNGMGYPLKQKNDEIECKILQLCDAFDMMFSGMETKRYSQKEILQYFKNQKDYFDLTLTDKFFEFVALYPAGARVLLSTGENAVVIRQNKNNRLPVVRVYDEETKELGEEIDLNVDNEIQITDFCE